MGRAGKSVRHLSPPPCRHHGECSATSWQLLCPGGHNGNPSPCPTSRPRTPAPRRCKSAALGIAVRSGSLNGCPAVLSVICVFSLSPSSGLFCYAFRGQPPEVPTTRGGACPSPSPPSALPRMVMEVVLSLLWGLGLSVI